MKRKQPDRDLVITALALLGVPHRAIGLACGVDASTVGRTTRRCVENLVQRSRNSQRSGPYRLAPKPPRKTAAQRFPEEV